MSRVIVLLGPPGAGKGTQAQLLSQALGVPHVSSGDLFRDHMSRETELGVLARGYISRGGLVPDEVTVGMVVERINRPDCCDGVILDGFPRTVEQAVALDGELAGRGLRVLVVLLITVQVEEAVRRLSDRRVCRECGAVYRLGVKPPRVGGTCDECGGELYRREDDDLDTVQKRLNTYFEETQPLVGYYSAKGLLAEVDGERAVEDVQVDVRALVETVGSSVDRSEIISGN